MNLHGGGSGLGGRNDIGEESNDRECGPMDRFGIQEIVCKECNVLQDSK